MAKTEYFYGLGRRKSASASVRLIPGKGQVTINGKSASDYLDNNKTLVAEVTDPLAAVSKQKDYDVTVLVKGGGLSGQVDAIKLGIAKALVVAHADLRPVQAGPRHRLPRRVRDDEQALCPRQPRSPRRQVGAC